MLPLEFCSGGQACTSTGGRPVCAIF